MESKNITLTPEEQRMVARLRTEAALPAAEDDDVGFERLFAKYPRQPITLSFLGKMFDESIKASVQLFAPMIQRLQAENVALRARVTVLETKAATVAWAGEHESGKSYRAGELVRRKGSVWLCLKDTSASPGMSLSDWELFARGAEVKA
jgi:hypothetical protein